MGEGDPGALGDFAGAVSEVTTIARVVSKGCMLILILLTVVVMILSVQHDLVDLDCLFICVLIMESTVFRQVI
jgi:hypothetical protein